jgi:hypothetical protein
MMHAHTPGYIVVGPVATVRDALALIEREAIDCAILDIELADGNAAPVTWLGRSSAKRNPKEVRRFLEMSSPRFEGRTTLS